MTRLALCLGVVIAPLAPTGYATRVGGNGGRAIDVGAERIGLTVESWVIRDRDHSLAAVLADLDTPPSWMD